MHAIADHHYKMERALAQLDQLESVIRFLQPRTLELEAWIEFHERRRRLDA
jgi:hypothetical protein